MTHTDLALALFSLACLSLALFFALDWNRMRRQRDAYRRAWMGMLEVTANPNAFGLRDLIQPRDPKTGRFTKRQG